MKRKDFLSKAAAGGSLLLVSPWYFSSCSSGDDDDDMDPGNGNNGDVMIDLSDSKYSALADVGGFVYVGNIIVIRTGTDQFTALSKVCTHQQCTVGYDPGTNELPCPCHNSRFNINGGVLNGPASSPLKKFTVTQNGNILNIT